MASLKDRIAALSAALEIEASGSIPQDIKACCEFMGVPFENVSATTARLEFEVFGTGDDDTVPFPEVEGALAPVEAAEPPVVKEEEPVEPPVVEEPAASEEEEPEPEPEDEEEEPVDSETEDLFSGGEGFAPGTPVMVVGANMHAGQTGAVVDENVDWEGGGLVRVRLDTGAVFLFNTTNLQRRTGEGPPVAIADSDEDEDDKPIGLLVPHPPPEEDAASESGSESEQEDAAPVVPVARGGRKRAAPPELGLAKRSRGGSSKYMGVRKEGNKWKAQLSINGQTRYLGSFDTELEAAQVVVAAREKHPKQIGSSAFKGVSVHGGRWQVQIYFGDGKQSHVGYFDREDDAARAYDDACAEHGLPRVNFA